jgi:hypothetical protein
MLISSLRLRRPGELGADGRRDQGLTIFSGAHEVVFVSPRARGPKPHLGLIRTVSSEYLSRGSPMKVVTPQRGRALVRHLPGHARGERSPPVNTQCALT